MEKKPDDQEGDIKDLKEKILDGSKPILDFVKANPFNESFANRIRRVTVFMKLLQLTCFRESDEYSFFRMLPSSSEYMNRMVDMIFSPDFENVVSVESILDSLLPYADYYDPE